MSIYQYQVYMYHFAQLHHSHQMHLHPLYTAVKFLTMATDSYQVVSLDCH